MADNYNQIRAMLAITKGSLKATFRSPSAVLFSIGFPLIFILVFGFIGGGGGYSGGGGGGVGSCNCSLVGGGGGGGSYNGGTSPSNVQGSSATGLCTITRIS